VHWYDPAATAAASPGLSGLDFLRAIRDRELPPPPMATLLGMALCRIEPGLVTFAYEPDESVYNPIGMVHGGVVCTLADTVIGCAVQTTLEAGVGYTSIDLQVSYLRSLTARTGPVTATGTVTKAGRRVAFGRAEMTDGGGRLLATATGTCLIIDGRDAQGP
jgi:uncharacterized protein (TIGR00369 family)